MKKRQKLIGHNKRVVHLGMSPDGENIVTGAGDETLRFWNVFPKEHKKQAEPQMSAFHQQIR
jgi:cell division cycle 20-like protein 1 (cofactor of APC complex)